MNRDDKGSVSGPINDPAGEKWDQMCRGIREKSQQAVEQKLLEIRQDYITSQFWLHDTERKLHRAMNEIERLNTILDSIHATDSKSICPDCGGSGHFVLGYREDREDVGCQICGGTGQLSHEQVYVLFQNMKRLENENAELEAAKEMKIKLFTKLHEKEKIIEEYNVNKAKDQKLISYYKLTLESQPQTSKEWYGAYYARRDENLRMKKEIIDLEALVEKLRAELEAAKLDLRVELHCSKCGKVPTTIAAFISDRDLWEIQVSPCYCDVAEIRNAALEEAAKCCVDRVSEQRIRALKEQ
jgi:hypothetical protein